MVTSAFSSDDDTGLSNGQQCNPEEWAEIKAAEQATRNEHESTENTISGEWEHYESSLVALGEYKQLERQALGNRPLSVIMANLTRDFRRMFDGGKARGLGTEEDHKAADEFCERLPGVELKLNSEVLKLSSLHRLIVTSIAGHMVMFWEPELVVQECIWCLGHIEAGSKVKTL